MLLFLKNETNTVCVNSHVYTVEVCLDPYLSISC